MKTIDDETAPKVIVKKIEGKMETLERHVPQMLLRGEQVAIIVKINWDSEYVLLPRNGHWWRHATSCCDASSHREQRYISVNYIYLFFYFFFPPPFCIIFFRAVLSNKRLQCFSLWFITRSWQHDSSKKKKNGAKIWNNSWMINYNRMFRVESKRKFQCFVSIL